MVASHPHIGADELSNYLLGMLSEARNSQIDLHLSTCDSCRDQASSLEPQDRLSKLLFAAHAESSVTPWRALSPDSTHHSSLEATPHGASTDSSDPASNGNGFEPRLPVELSNHPRYRVIRPLGQGGMGQVWLAEHLVMGRQVAIKMLRPELLNSPELRMRFQRELTSISKLKHPNIAVAYDAEQIRAANFLVMEWIDGENLLAMLEDGPLSVSEACRIIHAIAAGLSHAHDLGLIHRDVKPNNVMIDRDGTPKLLDFGLVVVSDAGSGVTSRSILMGTPDYVAPEQAEDPRSANVQSDIYSLGCTLYHLLAGHVPFPEASVLRKLDAHRYQKPKPIDGLSAELSHVLDKMMAKSPGDRFQSMKEVVDHLRPFLADRDSRMTRLRADGTGAVPRATSRRRYLIGGGCVIGAAGFGWLGLSLKRRDIHPDIQPSESASELLSNPSFSPIGPKLRDEFILATPSSIAQGTAKSFRFKDDTLHIQTFNDRHQLWLNYLEHTAFNLELRCHLLIRESAERSFFKLVLMEHNEQGSEYTVQIQRENSSSQIRIEHGNLVTQKTTKLWSGPDPTNYAASPIDFGIRLFGSKLAALIDDQAVAEIPVLQKNKCFTCISVWGCDLEAKRPVLRVYS